jgi:SnoaL-like domain
MNEAQQLADRYVAAWNETDPGARRKAIESLWTEQGEHYVDTRRAVGFAALEDRISRSHEKNVAGLGNRFRAVQDARRLQNAVTFHWQMLPGDGDTVLATGLEFLIVNDGGRIEVDYQFIVT